MRTIRSAYDIEMDNVKRRGERDNELSALRARITELEAATVLTPRQCNRACFERGWQAAIEAAAVLVENEQLPMIDLSNTTRMEIDDVIATREYAMADSIRALTPPDCGDCNPLKPDAQSCGICKNFERCKMIFGCKPESTECDWIPSKFERA